MGGQTWRVGEAGAAIGPTRRAIVGGAGTVGSGEVVAMHGMVLWKTRERLLDSTHRTTLPTCLPTGGRSHAFTAARTPLGARTAGLVGRHVSI